jgi:hypothetical protein
MNEREQQEQFAAQQQQLAAQQQQQYRWMDPAARVATLRQWGVDVDNPNDPATVQANLIYNQQHQMAMMAQQNQQVSQQLQQVAQQIEAMNRQSQMQAYLEAAHGRVVAAANAQGIPASAHHSLFRAAASLMHAGIPEQQAYQMAVEPVRQLLAQQAQPAPVQQLRPAVNEAALRAAAPQGRGFAPPSASPRIGGNMTIEQMDEAIVRGIGGGRR